MTTLNFVGAAFVGLGGVVGYVKTQSLPSLVAGLAFSISIALATQCIKSADPSTKNLGIKLTRGLWLLLAFLMGYRFYKTQKLFPAGLVFLVSVGLSVYNFLQL